MLEIFQRTCTSDQTVQIFYIFSNFQKFLYTLIFLKLEFSVHNSACYILYTEAFPVVLLYARVQYVKQLYYTIYCTPW